MDELKEEIKQIEELWKKVYDNCSTTPSVYTPYLPNLTVDEIGSVVLTVLEWMKSLDNNKNVRKTYVLAKAIMQITLNATITSLKRLASGEYNHFNQFITYLNQLLTALFPITFLNSKDKSYANLSLDMAEELVKLKELSQKMEAQQNLYDSVIELKENTETVNSDIQKIKIDVENTKSNILKTETDINTLHESVKEKIDEVTPLIEDIGTFANKIPLIEKNNNDALMTLSDLIEEANNIKETLHELLPDSTSAGLASAFHTKSEELKTTKKWLMTGFVISIITLSFTAFYSFYNPISSSSSGDLSNFTQRCLILFSPVWLGWFFARSYGHANRLQEKYDYKEAMSKAFQGYRKQMEEVDTNSELAKNLSELTLAVLAENPSEVFERNCWDETPFHSMISMVLKRLKFGNKNTSIE
ncbi:MAG: hypothetical protein IKV03_03590 [Alphaproteobacteria bacterium]|nr:hypothetical protein [Alphaproteobacteria bacterium]